MIDTVKTWFASPHVVDVALVMVAVELLVLGLIARRRGRTLFSLGGQVVAGVFLLLALRIALAGGDPLWIGVFLAASFPAHLLDVAARMR